MRWLRKPAIQSRQGRAKMIPEESRRGKGFSGQRGLPGVLNISLLATPQV